MIKYIVLFLFISINVKAQLSDFKNINFKKADSIALIYRGESIKSLPILSHKLTTTLSTDVEKFRAIYMWVCSNIEIDYESFSKNARMRRKFRNDTLKLYKWNKDFSKRTFKKLVSEKKTVCTGYSYLIKELAFFSNINCEMVDGYGRTKYDKNEKNHTPNHSWNAVQLNNKWYLCDPTWSSGVFNLDNYYFEYVFNEGYFLTNPELFLKNHFPLDTKWLLTETKMTINDFFEAPLVYDMVFRYGIMPIEPFKIKTEVNKNNEITFTYRELKLIDDKEFKFEVVSGKNVNMIQPKIFRTKENGTLTLKCSFKHTGEFDIHLKVNDDYLVTYIIKVKKN